MKLIHLFLLILVGCGHKTNPLPYPISTVKSTLVTLQVHRPIFQGDKLRVEWSLPKGETTIKLSQFQLHFRYRDTGCPACPPKKIGWIAVTPLGQLTSSWVPAKTLKTHFTTWSPNKNHYGILIPSHFFNAKKTLFLYLDYLSTQDQTSQPSRSYRINQPLKIIKPTLINAHWGQKNQPRPRSRHQQNSCTPLELKNCDLVPLSITWTPVVERTYQEIDRHGGITTYTQRLKLWLYLDKQALKPPLNQSPLNTGEATLEVKKGPLWARHQDHFGNLSAPTAITPEGP